MTTIQLRDVEGAARRLMRAASIEIPKDFSGQVRRMAGQLDNPLACFVLNSMLDTWDAADADQRPDHAGFQHRPNTGESATSRTPQEPEKNGLGLV